MRVINRKTVYILIVVLFIQSLGKSQAIPGFNSVPGLAEQTLLLDQQFRDVQIEINAPASFSNKGKTYLILYALPNGNSIEWTRGKKMNTGDDWHYDIQHIAAQTRFIRATDTRNNYIVVYLANSLKSWPAWRRNNPNAGVQIQRMVDTLVNLFKPYEPHLVLNGHSGGGSFIFGYLNAVNTIPSVVDRIAFLDSDYGYEDSLHSAKLVQWLQQDRKNHLFVLAYNDSIVIFNGKPLVSPTGGTWYRSKLLQQNLARSFKFTHDADTSFIHYTALKGRVEIILKENPRGLIYHTVMVEKNGFIHSILFNTRYDKRKYYTYFGDRSYSKYIE